MASGDCAFGYFGLLGLCSTDASEAGLMKHEEPELCSCDLVNMVLLEHLWGKTAISG